MKRFQQFDMARNFWKEFPELLSYEVFLDIKEGVEDSSMFMWAVHLCEHPKSMIYRDPNKYVHMKDKLSKVTNKKKRAQIMDKYRELILTPGERALVRWESNVRKVNKYAEDMDLSTLKPNEIKSMIDTLEKCGKLFNAVPEIMAKIQEEEDKINEKVSLSQDGII
jgi:hypothetical protein